MENLTQYLLKQDREMVARACSGFMVDFCRIRSMNDLPEKELACLVERIDQNAKTVHRFAKNGPEGEFKVVKVSNAEEINEHA